MTDTEINLYKQCILSCDQFHAQDPLEFLFWELELTVTNKFEKFSQFFHRKKTFGQFFFLMFF